MSNNIVYKVINGSDWEWAEDYIYLYAEYVVSCEPGRQCQVGMGVFIDGEPRGEKIRFSGPETIKVLLVGALYFRVDDGKGPCKIAFTQKDNQPLSWTW